MENKQEFFAEWLRRMMRENKVDIDKLSNATNIEKRRIAAFLDGFGPFDEEREKITQHFKKKIQVAATKDNDCEDMGIFEVIESYQK